MWFRVYGGVFLLGLFAAAMGVRITFQLTPHLWERRPPLRRLVVVCLVAATLVYPGMFVALHCLRDTMGVASLVIGMGCAALASAITTLVLMLVSR
jgi:hypothetical protein